MSQKKRQRTFTADQKATILKRHLAEKKPVSDVCEEYDIQPSVFYAWQKQLMDHMPVVLTHGASKKRAQGHELKLNQENEALKAKLAKKDSVIAEMSAEYVQLKKELGEL